MVIDNTAQCCLAVWYVGRFAALYSVANFGVVLSLRFSVLVGIIMLPCARWPGAVSCHYGFFSGKRHICRENGKVREFVQRIEMENRGYFMSVIGNVAKGAPSSFTHGPLT